MRIADYAVARGHAVLTTVGLGSCVAVALYDASTAVGGLAHILLPAEGAVRRPANPAKYAATAVPHLLAEMRALGAGRCTTARVVGGASMFTQLLGASVVNVGARNLRATLRALDDAGVPVTGQDTGGEHGRSVSFDLTSGRVLVRSLRRGDRVL